METLLDANDYSKEEDNYFEIRLDGLLQSFIKGEEVANTIISIMARRLAKEVSPDFNYYVGSSRCGRVEVLATYKNNPTQYDILIHVIECIPCRF